ncbi:nipped-B-like protein [Belonocnema kinseyi]|uniref:nipped-B-like protein n=1 Tax=Belonocnema kinseyi TaxID=2817044 RepID=UPI00143D42D8|nr:nipped-B-like protein [Belonocnema kinseyi]XP_033210702.1 nipped-B-like protein [Belonocnema kinseyi]XP_033210703.1 nipped-B-like protein [Belonocnema kinseyi]
MPEQIKVKMNGVIPSVPITTLAGIASLSDLLSEMPLPTPLPQTPLTNKSLLFHPRVAEEAQILLSVRDDNLVPQLISSLSQTSSDHIELKDHYNVDQSLESDQSTPELLKAILEINPNVFKGPQYNSPRNWPQGTPMLHSNQSPANYGRFSPSYSNSSGSRQTPQGSPAHSAGARTVLPPPPSSGISHAQHPRMPVTPQNYADMSQMSPFAVPSPSPRASVITEQTRTSTTPQHMSEDSNLTLSSANNPQPTMYSPAHMSSPNAPLSSLGNLTSQSHHMTTRHSMHMASPMHVASPMQVVSPMHVASPMQVASPIVNSPLQTDPMQTVNLQQNIFEPILSQMDTQSTPSTQNIHNNQMPIGNALQEPQLIIDPVTGLPDVAMPIVNPEQQQQISSQNASQQSVESVPSIQSNPDASQKSVSSSDNPSQNTPNTPKPSNTPNPPNTPSTPNTPVNSDKPPSAEKEQKMMKEPVVMLNRLSLADQALMQKSLKSFAQKAPTRAAKMGLTNSKAADSESDSEEEIGKNNKHFKARAKERQEKREKERAERKKEEEKTPRRRKRCIEDDEEEEEAEAGEGKKEKEEIFQPPKPKIRKYEKKLVPVLAKLSVEELMETNTYQRFNSTMDTVFENTEDAANMTDEGDDGDVPQELLIQKYHLQELCTEAAKLKALGAMESIPTDRLVRLLNILEKNIRDGARVSPLADPEDDAAASRRWVNLAMERVQRAVDASLISLHIMTSSNMPKNVYLEDVIDRIIVFMKFQLQNTIYPSFDPVYRIDSKSKTETFNSSGRKKRGHAKEVREKSILQVYNKMTELVGLLSELFNIQILTDTSVLHASTLGVSPFFVESVSDLQLSALKLVTVIFTKYEKHRRLLLDDILASIARLPSSKRSLRTYRLSSEDHIQMLTALVLQLIQCVVVLPESIVQDKSPKKERSKDKNKNKDKDKGKDKDKDKSKEEEDEEKEKKAAQIDADVLIINRYENATRTAANFLTVFLNKCGSKGEEVDYRPLFENFIQDLLATVNKPEWPAAELLLSLLGNLLAGHFSNKGSDMSLRVASIDYLGVVAARLRKDAVSSQCKLSTIDQIIKDIKAEQQKDSDYDKIKDKGIKGLTEDEERTVFLQKVLLDYLAVNGTKDAALGYARHFYLVQWYRDCAVEKTRVGQPNRSPSKKSNKKRSKKKNRHHSSEESESEIEEIDPDENDNNEQKNSEAYRIIEEKKKLIVSKIRPNSSGTKPDILQTYIDYQSAELISQYLASKRSFSQSFDRYLKQILQVLTESSIAIRTKAMKCLTMIVEADPSVLGRVDMQMGVKHSFLDHSTSVREAAVDLVGKFILSRPELIDKYYDMLSSRILDTGVSVRKRVIKILKDVCMECPDFPKIPEICVKMIRRVNDEEGIRKLVMEVFQNMWFTPVREKPAIDSEALLRKVMNITDVVAASKDMGLEWFEQLLVSLFKPKEDKEDSTKLQTEPPKVLLTACKQIVECLIENILRLEETPLDGAEQGEKKGSPQRLVACLTTLHLFAKIRPQLLVDHAITLQPYLSLKCQTQGDYQIISSVAHTLELVVPLIEHPSETFLAQLEEDSVKLILQHDKSVVASCLSCLGSIVNNVTRNFKLIRDCFNKYYGHLTEYKSQYEKDPNNPILLKYRPFFRRALFTVGLLLRHFDFTLPEVIEGLPDNIKNQVFETLTYFVHLDNDDIKYFTLKSIGSLCIRHYDFMMLSELKELYHYLLTSDLAPVNMRIQVLNNIEIYLQEEETRMIKQDQEWAKLSKQENLKEMGDVSSGMASTVIQLYLKEILESFVHVNVGVRHAALKVIQLILAQGLVHPVQIVPYLVCMSTDCEKMVSHSADKQLQDIEKKYPGFIHMRAQFGIKLSYRLQSILQNDTTVRGMRTKEGEYPSALNGFLYTILRNTKQQRRAIVLSFLKQFDETAKTSLSQMLFLADNLAYFAYQVQDEPLFIIHHIDIIISLSGTNVLQSFREGLLPKDGGSRLPNFPAEQTLMIGPDGQPRADQLLSSLEDEEDDEEDEEALMVRLPEDTTILRQLITASQGFLLLLNLRQHLKDLYGFSDAKIGQYSPSESAKVYEKAVTRKSTLQFKPKATLQKLKEGENNEELDEEGKRKLLKEYLDFRQLMLKFDPDDPDEDADGEKRDTITLHGVNADSNKFTGGTVTIHEPVAPSNNSTDHPNNSVSVSPPRVPKITIRANPDMKEHTTTTTTTPRKPRQQKTKEVRKQKKKKRRRISDSSDSGDDYSDPDFQM